MRYESERDVELRLKNSVVMYKGRPVYVSDVHDVERVRIADLITEERDDVRVRDLDLAPASAPLGYVIGEDGKLYYAMRRPVRKYKQGLTRENLLSFDALNKPDDKRMLELVRGDGSMRAVSPFARPIGNTIMGIFPTVGEAFTAVRKGQVKAAPFSRDWAVADKDEELCLLFRGDVVGYVGGDSVKLLPDRFYLKESLQICLA